MTVERAKLDKAQTRRLLQQREGHFLDFKGARAKPNTVTKCLSALANADGGDVWIGIDELQDKSHIWNGFPHEEDANGLIQEIEKVIPLGEEVDLTIVESTEGRGYVLNYQIRKTRAVVTASDGIAYLRRSAQSIPQSTPEQMERLRLNKGISSQEEKTLNVPSDTVEDSDVVKDFISNVVPTTVPPTWLSKQRLIRNGKPTVASVILFADEPQSLLPKAAIKIYRYNTSERASRETLVGNPETIEGCAYQAITKAVERVSEISEAHNVIGVSGLESVKYPREAVHEIITNAIIHRDYSLNDDVHVRVFNNRIEVQSPGTLPAHITKENILDERFARNPVIVRILNKFPDPPNKDVGEGLNTAVEAMRKLKLKDPVVESTAGSVIVTLKHEPLAAAEEIILDYLLENPTIFNERAREITHIGSENKIKNLFNKLIDTGLIVRLPERSGKRVLYKITVKGRNQRTGKD